MLTWYVADWRTGGFIEEMPFKADSIEVSIGEVRTCGVSLDIPDPSVVAQWSQILDGRRALIVPVDDGLPLAAFRLYDTPGAGTATVSFTLATDLDVLDQVNVTDYEPADGTDEADIAAHLVQAVAAGWGYEVVVTKTGTTGDHTYAAAEDRTILSALTDLAAQDGGPEFVTRIRWEDSTHRRFIKTIEIGPQVGRDLTGILFEDVHLAENGRRRPRSWKKLGVITTATGDGSGADRPMSTPVIDTDALAAGIPPWEVRVPATSLDTDDALDRTAIEASRRYRYGTQGIEIDIAQTTEGPPRVGHDWTIGDRVPLQLKPMLFDPVGIDTIVRPTGWRATISDGVITTVTPTLYSGDDD